MPQFLMRDRRIADRMNVVERGGAYRALIAFALLLGAAFGVALFHGEEPHYGFVGDARPIRVAEFHQGSTYGTLRIYNVHLDWRKLLGLVERESSITARKVGLYHGLPAETVVVPQTAS